jgi:signal transduction histidine kinase
MRPLAGLDGGSGTDSHGRDQHSDRTSSDVTWARQIAAFAEAALVIARESDLSTVLDRLAYEVRAVTGLPTCAIILVDRVTEVLRHVGGSGLPDDFPERVEEARRSGVPMATLEAYRTCRTVVARGSRARILEDPRWGSTQSILRDSNWDTFIAVPLIIRDAAIGVLTGYSPAGSEPTPAALHFLEIMADHAAIAVDNARMSAQLQLSAAEGERQRLARDLHDSVSQALFSLSLEARGLELRFGAAAVEPVDRGELVEGLAELRTLAQEALSEVRSLIEYRRPLELRDDGLLPALETLAESTSRKTGLTVEVHCSTVEQLRLDKAVEEDLFRLVQEALNNVAKHAQARSAIVDVHPDLPGEGLFIEVTDDGVGLGEPSGVRAHFGMETMRERAARHGAQLTFRPGPNGVGTQVRVSVPGVLSAPPALASPREGTSD